jgi:hypothetical protein
LIARIYEVFPLLCPICGGQMRIIAFITHSADIRQILDHIGVDSELPHISPARGPPLWDDCGAHDGTQIEPDLDLMAQPAPEFDVDQRVNWCVIKTAIQACCGTGYVRGRPKTDLRPAGSRFSGCDRSNGTGQRRLDAKYPCHTCPQAVEFPIRRSTQLRQLIFAVIVIAAVTCLHGWSVIGLYWFVPMFTVLIALMYVRDIGEHFAMSGPGWNFTRTTLVGCLEGFFISPYHVNFHAEHHMYPVVPASELPGLHHALMKTPWYAKRAVISRGYLSGVLHDATKNRS